MPWILFPGEDAGDRAPVTGSPSRRSSGLLAFLHQDLGRLAPFRGTPRRSMNEAHGRILRAERMLGVDVTRRARDTVELNVRRVGKARLDPFTLEQEPPRPE